MFVTRIFTDYKTFAENGLPPLGPQRGSNSTASLNDGHRVAKLLERSFAKVKDLHLSGGRSIWVSKQQGAMDSFLNERKIQMLVRNVISDAITAVGLVEQLACEEEMSIFRVKPDIWILTKSTGIPVGVVEVKIPDPEKMDNGLIHGQIYDYMARLESFYGLQHVFGIVSTYQQWRICWFPSSDNAARATEIEPQPKVAPQSESENEETEGQEKVEHSEEYKREYIITFYKRRILTVYIRRKIYGTSLIEWNDKELPALLASVILKMYHSPTAPVKRFSSQRPYIAMTDTNWTWEAVKWGAKFQANYKTMPSTQPDKLFLLEDFRGGVDGRVWLACSKQGEICVIKFDHMEKKEALEKEAQHWRDIWGHKDTQVITLSGKPALMMPYMKRIENWKDPQILEATKQAVRTMASKGFVHKDLKKRHVGIMSPSKKGERYQVGFLDLRQVEPMEETEALQSMFNALSLDQDDEHGKTHDS